MQPTITPPKTFKLKTHLVFTTIEIKKYGIIRTWFMAKFKTGTSEHNLEVETIKGVDLSQCLQNIEKFLDCQIDERHYVIK